VAALCRVSVILVLLISFSIFLDCSLEILGNFCAENINTHWCLIAWPCLWNNGSAR
jgi:hypothetical protein